MFTNDNPQYNYVQVLFDEKDQNIISLSCDCSPITYPVVSRPQIIEAIPEHDPVVEATIDYTKPELRYVYTDLKVSCAEPLDSSNLINNIVVLDNNFSFGDNIQVIESSKPNFPAEDIIDVNI